MQVSQGLHPAQLAQQNQLVNLYSLPQQNQQFQLNQPSLNLQQLQQLPQQQQLAQIDLSQLSEAELQALGFNFGKAFKKAVHGVGHGVAEAAKVIPKVVHVVKPIIQQGAQMLKKYDRADYDKYVKPAGDAMKKVDQFGNAIGGWNGIEHIGEGMEHFVILI